jgi:DNA-binding transcriptional LysR family regulator
VSELQSFSKTAQELDYSQSTVTMQIQQLENELGVKLFDRVGRTVCVTPAGEKLIGYATSILQMSEQAVSDLREEEVRGKLRIAASESIRDAYFPEILRIYHERCPLVDVVVKSGGQREMFSMLSHNEIDMIYTLDEKICKNDQVKVMEAPAEAFFFAGKGHPLAKRKKIDPKELLEYEMIMTEKGMSYREQLENILDARGLELKPYLELGSTEMIRKLLENGMGISFLPEYTVRESLKAGTIVKLDIPECSIMSWRQLIRKKNKFVTPQMQKMFDLIIEMEH